MGTYIYSLRSPKLVAKVKLDNGNVVTVGRYAFEYKPLWGCLGNEPRWQILAKARISKLENIWHKFINGGGKYPMAGVLVNRKDTGYKIDIGSDVFTWNVDSVPISIEDCTMNGATHIGKIVEIVS